MGEKFMLTIDDLRCQGPGSPLISKEAAKQVERLHLQRIANLESQVKSARQGKARAIEAIQARVRELEQEVERLRKENERITNHAAAELGLHPAERPKVQQRPTQRLDDPGGYKYNPRRDEQPSGEPCEKCGRPFALPIGVLNETEWLAAQLRDARVALVERNRELAAAQETVTAMRLAIEASEAAVAATQERVAELELERSAALARITALESAAKLVSLPEGARFVLIEDGERLPTSGDLFVSVNGEPRESRWQHCLRPRMILKVIPASSFGVPDGKAARALDSLKRHPRSLSFWRFVEGPKWICPPGTYHDTPEDAILAIESEATKEQGTPEGSEP